MSDQEIYEAFIKWLRKAPLGVPESEHLRPLIKSYYTPEEAEFLTGIPFSLKSLEELAAIKEMEPTELKPKLKELAKKGMIYESIRGESAKFRLGDFMFVFFRASGWHGQDIEPIKSTAPFINKYFDTWAEQFRHVKKRGLRSIPIDKTIEYIKGHEDVLFMTGEEILDWYNDVVAQ